MIISQGMGGYDHMETVAISTKKIMNTILSGKIISKNVEKTVNKYMHKNPCKST